jgi:hypothetical protein
LEWRQLSLRRKHTDVHCDPCRNAGLYEALGLDDEELNMTLGIMCSRTIIGFDGSPALQ